MQIHSYSSLFYHIINSNSIQQDKALQNLLFCILTILFLLPESVQHMDFCVNGKGLARSYRRSIVTKIHMLFSATKQKRIIMNTRFISLIFYFTSLPTAQLSILSVCVKFNVNNVNPPSNNSQTLLAQIITIHFDNTAFIPSIFPQPVY